MCRRRPTCRCAATSVRPKPGGPWQWVMPPLAQASGSTFSPRRALNNRRVFLGCGAELGNGFMRGVERLDRELLDAGALVGHLVAEDGMFAFLAAHRQELFGDEKFEDLFPSGRGRPSIPASVMASILVPQNLLICPTGRPPRRARCDLRWKVATRMASDHKGFDPSTLVYWWKRLAKSDRPHRIKEAVRQVIDGDEPGAKDALVSALVNDANAVLAVFADLDQDELEESVRPSLALLALVAGQDVEPAEGSDGTDGRRRIARRVAPDRVISTVDSRGIGDRRRDQRDPTDSVRAAVPRRPRRCLLRLGRGRLRYRPDVVGQW